MNKFEWLFWPITERVQSLKNAFIMHFLRKECPNGYGVLLYAKGINPQGEMCSRLKNQIRKGKPLVREQKADGSGNTAIAFNMDPSKCYLWGAQNLFGSLEPGWQVQYFKI